MKKTTVVIADDHPVVRMGVRAMLRSHPELTVVGEANDGVEALQLVEQQRPHVLLLDLAMPRLPGMETLRELTHRSEETKTVLLTAQIDQPRILEALQLGAHGVVLKEAVARDLIDCLLCVRDGKYWLNGQVVVNLVQVIKNLVAAAPPGPPNTFGLTPREMQVVSLIVQGCANREIAAQCGITDETVKRHLKNIFDKLGVSSRLELAMYAVNHHLVEN